MTEVTREEVLAFIAGQPLPDDVSSRIERMYNQQGSVLQQVSEEIAEKTRIAFDPERGPFGDGVVI